MSNIRLNNTIRTCQDCGKGISGNHVARCDECVNKILEEWKKCPVPNLKAIDTESWDEMAKAMELDKGTQNA